MPISYAKEAIKILQNEGLLKLFKKYVQFMLDQVDPHHYYRFMFHTEKNRLQNRLYYDVPPDPYHTITIEPKKIDFRLRRKNDSMVIPKAKHEGIGRIRGGDWDKQCKKIEDISDTRGAIIKGMRERFEEQKSWEDTDYYRIGIAEYENKSKNVGYGSVEKYVQDRLRSYERLYENISTNGYRINHRENSLRPGDTEPIESQLEVLVTIGRDGEIYLFGGYHRFGIARVLDIKIPAQVVCRHKQWQELRDEIHSNGLSEAQEDLRDHPDLQDILD